MTDRPDLADDALTLDANAVAGMLQEIFGADMTTIVSECAHCGNHAELGSLRAYIGPGIVLRCSICHQVEIRIMTMPDGSHRVDVRGAAYLRM